MLVSDALRRHFRGCDTGGTVADGPKGAREHLRHPESSMQAGPLLRLPVNAKPAQNGTLRTIPPLSSGCKRIVSITDNDGYGYDSSIAHGRLQSTIDVIAKFHVA